MPDDVKAAFVQIVQNKLTVETVEAERYVAELERTKRYQLECW